jgi:hypothetical protein
MLLTRVRSFQSEVAMLVDFQRRRFLFFPMFSQRTEQLTRGL